MENRAGDWVLEAVKTHDLMQMSVLPIRLQHQDYDRGTVSVEFPVALTPAVAPRTRFVSVTNATPLSEACSGVALEVHALPGIVPTMAVETKKTQPEFSFHNVALAEVSPCAVTTEVMPCCASPKALSGVVHLTQTPPGVVPVADELPGSAPMMQEPVDVVTTRKESVSEFSEGNEPPGFVCVVKKPSGLVTRVFESTGFVAAMQGPDHFTPKAHKPTGLLSAMEKVYPLVPIIESSVLVPVMEEPAGLVPLERHTARLTTVFPEPLNFVPLTEEFAGVVPVGEDPARLAEESSGLVILTGDPSCMVPVVEEPPGVILIRKEPASIVSTREKPAVPFPVAEVPTSKEHPAKEPDGIIPVNEVLAGMGLVSDPCVRGMWLFENIVDCWPRTTSILAWNAADVMKTLPWTMWKDISTFTQAQESLIGSVEHNRPAPIQALNGMKAVVKHRMLKTLPYPVCAGLRDVREEVYVKNADNTSFVRQNAELLSALQELEHRYSTLEEENNLLRKNSFPEADEKVKRLKKKNAELAVIAKRLEERAHKLQEANLKVVNTPVHLKGSGVELCKKTFARQRAKDLAEQASALLAKDKEIEALQQECLELKSKLSARKECTNWLNLSDFDHLLRESQKEVLRLQRQIAIKYLKESLYLSKFGSCQSSPSAIRSSGAAVGGVHVVDNSVLSGTIYGDSTVTAEKIFPGNEAKENELIKKRKECENLEQEVRKKQKRCEELETILEDVRNENAILLEQNSLLSGRAAWTEKVESENADLRVQLGKVTEQRDSAVQEVLQLQGKLENLQKVLKHMREVAERRQHLEKEHEEALIALRGRQEEVKRLHQAHVEAKKEHEGAVHLLENTLDCMQARVKELEEKCCSQTKQFSLLSQELEHFRLCTGKHELSPSTMVTSELPVTSHFSSPGPSDANKEKGGPESSNPCTENIKNDVLESEGVHQPADTICECIKFKAEKSLVANEKENKKSLPSSPKSVSQNSSKSCVTPEVDTASEMEELDVDSVSLNPETESQAHAKIQVFLARYSYNPFEGPNENPEVELPLTAGEYIYIYGEMDGDGFYEGELMDGRRGLVPSNFVECVPDDDLMNFQPPEVSELSQSSCPEIGFFSSSSSMEKSDLPEEEEASLSPLLSHLPTGSEEPRDVFTVPYPRKLTLIKQLARSIVVGWEPPLVPAGYGSIQSYNIYLDAELRQNVQCGTPTKALLDKLDLKTKTYRVSVQSVTENGNSDRLRCTILVGHGYSIAPTHLRVRSLTATSAEISWQPSNSNYTHAVHLNEEDHGFTKAGIYWYTLRNLKPSTQYNIKVESRPHRTPWELPPDGRERKSTVMQLTTPSAGPPDAPLDVQVELGPTPGILNISWLPVTIDAAGTSNGVRVTGYAVYADGQKVLEVTSPTAGSVLLGMSHLELLQVSREVSVRTMSPHGESVDSVPAQIPSALLKVPDSLFHLNSSLVSEPPFGEYLDSQSCRIARARLTSSPYSPQVLQTCSSIAKITNHSVANELEYEEHTQQTEFNLVDSKSADFLTLKTSQHHLDSSLDSFSEHTQPVLNQDIKPLGPNSSKECIQGTACNLSQSAAVVGIPFLPKFCEVPAIPRIPALVGMNSNIQEKKLELPLITYSEPNCQATVDYDVKTETSYTQSGETLPKGGVTKPKPTEVITMQTCSSPESAVSEGSADLCIKAAFRGTSMQEFLELSSEENADAEDSSITWPADEAEEREISNLGGVHYASANRSSDLSDILEEEEDDSLAEVSMVKRFGQRDHSNIGERGRQYDSCETDSDEEILERIQELPLQNHCSKRLFSIPEVTEEEDDDEAIIKAEEIVVHSSCNMEGLKLHKMEDVSCMTIPNSVPKSVMADQERYFLSETFDKHLDNKDGFCIDKRTAQKENFYPIKGGLVSEREEDHIQNYSNGSPLWYKNKECNTLEQRGRCEGAKKCHTNSKEHCSRLLSNSSLLGDNCRKNYCLNEMIPAGACKGLKSYLDNINGKQGIPLKSHTNQYSSRFIRSTFKSEHSFSTNGLEIDIEYDTEDEDFPGISSVFSNHRKPNCKTKGTQAAQKGRSECSSQLDSTKLGQNSNELKQQGTLDCEGNVWMTHAPTVTTQWKGMVQSEEKFCSIKGSKKDECESLYHKKIIKKERYEKHGKDILDVSTHSRVSENGGHMLQPSMNSQSRHCSTRKITANLSTYSEQALVDVKALPVTNLAAFEGVKNCKNAPRDDRQHLFVALFDYDPVTMSPNPDADYEELPFKEGQIIKVFGEKDADGFYKGECNGKTGYIPCNMVSELQIENEEVGNKLLQCGFLVSETHMEIPDTGPEGIDTFPPTAHCLAVPPPKPRRSKKEPKMQVCITDKDVARTMVAIFDYNPRESSPNADIEAELTFSAGDVITVFGNMDDDGFYYGELYGQRGLVPSNFLEVVTLPDEENGIRSLETNSRGLNKEPQLHFKAFGKLTLCSPEDPSVFSSPLSTPEHAEPMDICFRSVKKKGLFFKGRKLLKKLGSSKKD